jgi:hypothetical protein
MRTESRAQSDVEAEEEVDESRQLDTDQSILTKHT